MLGSPVDGEALGAARALARTLASAGADLHALADIVEHQPAPPRPTSPSRTPPARPRRRAKQAPEPPGRGGTDLPPRTRARIIASLQDAEQWPNSGINPWEREFIGSIIATLQSNRPRISAKQLEVIQSILMKVGDSL